MSNEEAPKGAEPTANAGAAGEAEANNQPVSSEVNERLLAESKHNKKRAQDLQAKLNEMEKSTLQEQAKYKELWQKSEEKYQGLYKSLVKEKIRTAVSDKASKAGCRDVDDLLKLGDVRLLQINEETLEVEGADVFVEEVKKVKPYLFATQNTPTINPATPGGVLKGGQKSVKEMTKDEIMSQLRALKQ